MPATPRQEKLAANTIAMERWLRRLFRAATELKKLNSQRKRLLKGTGHKAMKYNLHDIALLVTDDEMPEL